MICSYMAMANSISRSRVPSREFVLRDRDVCSACLVDWPLRALVPVAKRITEKHGFSWLRIFVIWHWQMDMKPPDGLACDRTHPQLPGLARRDVSTLSNAELFNRIRRRRTRYVQFLSNHALYF